MVENKNLVYNSVNLRDIFKILIKRKVIFFISFVIIIILGLAFTFLVSPNYLSISKIKITRLDTQYNDVLVKFFPSESYGLLIFSTDRILNLEVDELNNLLNQIKYGETLNYAVQKINNKFSKSDLTKSNDFRVDSTEETITINIYRRNPLDSYQINKTYIDYFVSEKNSGFEKTYTELLKNIDNVLIEKNENLNNLLAEAENYVISFNIKASEEFKKSSSGISGFSGINYLPPTLQRNIEDSYKDVNNLMEAKKLLKNNKELFTKRIEVLVYPAQADVINYSNYLRNIILSFFAAIIFAAIISFIVNYFKTQKN